MHNDLPLSAQGNLPPGATDNACGGRDPYRPSRQIERNEDGEELEIEIRDHALENPDPYEME